MKEGLDGCDLISRYKKRFLSSLFFRVDFYVIRIVTRKAVKYCVWWILFFSNRNEECRGSMYIFYFWLIFFNRTWKNLKALKTNFLSQHHTMTDGVQHTIYAKLRVFAKQFLLFHSRDLCIVVFVFAFLTSLKWMKPNWKRLISHTS